MVCSFRWKSNNILLVNASLESPQPDNKRRSNDIEIFTDIDQVWVSPPFSGAGDLIFVLNAFRQRIGKIATQSQRNSKRCCNGPVLHLLRNSCPGQELNNLYLSYPAIISAVCQVPCRPKASRLPPEPPKSVWEPADESAGWVQGTLRCCGCYTITPRGWLTMMIHSRQISGNRPSWWIAEMRCRSPLPRTCKR